MIPIILLLSPISFFLTFRRKDKTMEQLRMTFPLEYLDALSIPDPPEGFELRTSKAGEEQAYADLMLAAGFDNWTVDLAAQVVSASSLPEGIFFAVERATGRLAGTAMANRPDAIGHQMGWVAVHPEFRGKGLARLVSSAALNRFKAENCTLIYLLTDDFRKNALRLYLRMGWRPWMPDCCDDTHPARWEAIHKELGI